MTLETYLARFRLLQHGIEKDERGIALLSTQAYRSFLSCFAGTESKVLQEALQSEQTLKKGLEKKKRLMERYALRLTRAISLIESPALRDYALYRYVYGLTYEELAMRSFYCVRTIYRHAGQARKALEAAMRQVKPKAIRCRPGRFYHKGPLPRKKADLDQLTRSVAAGTALRRRQRYLEVLPSA